MGRGGRESQPGHWQRRRGLSRLSFSLSSPLPSGPRLLPPPHRVQTPSLGRHVGLSDGDLVGDRVGYGRPRRRCKPLAEGPRHSPRQARLRRQLCWLTGAVCRGAGWALSGWRRRRWGRGAVGARPRSVQGRPPHRRPDARTAEPTPGPRPTPGTRTVPLSASWRAHPLMCVR